MGSIVCPITGLPLRYDEPVVALLLTAASSRVSADAPASPTDVWIPRTVPLRGNYDDFLRAKYDPSPLADLWTEGLRIDAVPRRARDGEFKRIGPHAEFDDFVNAARACALRVRNIEHVGMPSAHPGTPTRSRVVAILDGMRDRDEPVRCGWGSTRCPVFGFVEVDLYGKTREGVDDTTGAIIAASSARGWRAWVRHVSDYMNERTLVIGPADVADAACREVERLAAMPYHGSYPVALAFYSRAGWESLATESATARHLAAIEAERARWSTDFVRDIAAQCAAALTPRHAPAPVREAIRLRELIRAARMDNVVRDGFCCTVNTIDLRWSLARVLEHRHEGTWSETVAAGAERAVAEVIAIHEALRAMGRQWSIGSLAGDCVTVGAVRRSAAFTVREARRRLADATQNGDE